MKIFGALLFLLGVVLIYFGLTGTDITKIIQKMKSQQEKTPENFMLEPEFQLRPFA